MSCKAKLKSGSNKGKLCGNKAKNGKYCGRHKNEGKKSKSDKEDDDREKDIKWETDNIYQMNDRIKSSKKRRICNELMTLKEEDESSEEEEPIKPVKEKKKDKQNESKSADEISMYEEELISEDSSDSYDNSSSFSKNSIAGLVRLGAVSVITLAEGIVDEQTDFMISGTMKELTGNEQAMDALDDIIEEYLPDRLLGEEASPLMVFATLYLTNAALTHKKNIARAQILNELATNNIDKINLNVVPQIQKESDKQVYNGFPGTQELNVDELFAM